MAGTEEYATYLADALADNPALYKPERVLYDAPPPPPTAPPPPPPAPEEEIILDVGPPQRRSGGGYLAEGYPVPFFEAEALGDTATVYTPETLGGRTYLIHFWATWCDACTDAIGALQPVYEKYEDNGFAVLSVSLDWSPEAVRTFRRDEAPMPWLHTFAAEGTRSALAQQFRVDDVPRYVLVGSEGTVLGQWDDLSVPTLDAILERLLD